MGTLSKGTIVSMSPVITVQHHSWAKMAYRRCTSLMIRCSKPGLTTSCRPSSAAMSLSAACISRSKSFSEADAANQ